MFMLFFSLPLLADDMGEPLHVADLEHVHRVSVHPEFLAGAKTHSLHSVMQSVPENAWKQLPLARTNYPAVSSGYWLRFTVTGLAARAGPTFVQLAYPHLDYVDFYALNDGEILSSYSTGDRYDFDTRPVDHRDFVFPISSGDLDTVEIYLRVETSGLYRLPLTVTDELGLERNDKLIYLFYGVLFGVFALMILYSTTLLIKLRERVYFYFLLFVIAAALLRACFEGLAFQYLWPQSPQFANQLLLLLSNVIPLLGVMFILCFLDIGRSGNQFEKALRPISCVLVAANILVGLGISYSLSLTINFAVTLLAVMASLYLGFKAFQRGQRAAKTFLIAWGGLLVFILIFGLYSAGYFDDGFITENALALGSLFQLTVLSLSFAARINEQKDRRIIAQKESLRSQKQLTEELDHLVEARTRELEKANEQLRQLTVTDSLTGLSNRRHFQQVLTSEFRKAFWEAKDLCIIMLDINHFKQINDTYGHQIGDESLAYVASCISDGIRKPSDLAARIGGEEFACLLPGVDLDSAMGVAERIREIVSTPFTLSGGVTMRLTASLGVASLTSDKAESGEALLQTADQRLYRAKHGGRDRVVAEA